MGDEVCLDFYKKAGSFDYRLDDFTRMLLNAGLRWNGSYKTPIHSHYPSREMLEAILRGDFPGDWEVQLARALEIVETDIKNTIGDISRITFLTPSNVPLHLDIRPEEGHIILGLQCRYGQFINHPEIPAMFEDLGKDIYNLFHPSIGFMDLDRNLPKVEREANASSFPSVAPITFFGPEFVKKFGQKKLLDAVEKTFEISYPIITDKTAEELGVPIEQREEVDRQLDAARRLSQKWGIPAPALARAGNLNFEQEKTTSALIESAQTLDDGGILVTVFQLHEFLDYTKLEAFEEYLGLPGPGKIR